MKCTFFGHRDVPQKAEINLKQTVIDLIEHHGADMFYVGNQGGFDRMVRRVLKELKNIYPHITFMVVLAYMPEVRKTDDTDYSETIYPDGLENTPKKFAIPKRNRWMIDHSDVVVTYVKYSTGGAAEYRRLAEKKGKRVINIV